MNELVEATELSSRREGPEKAPPYRSFLTLSTRSLAILALLAGVILLGYDLSFATSAHALISATPLLLIGVASLAFLLILRPRPLDLLKALIVSVAFILWGVDQLLPAGWWATTLGDIVIVLYVIDLGWMLLSQRNA
ncbi:hypothetical protein [Tengunoibacter tsumagoiensis]|uniref:Uncharacterized protein n=1 Tax=Tengunoibacter tsumagoiensis TaxID=2014871 RepID=A0A401ZXC7_9CHLR|nr:hypothetical protein [Tengunoibacter tsumagoiensis]GCE11499.1 hypothetical protein KTT_13580 [Tengunoibacter tsumagoiensis]